jgi:hypothetical protein
MKIISYISVSSRFARRLFFLLGFAVLILSLIILFIRRIQTEDQHVPRYNAPNQIKKIPKSTAVKEGLPLIHQPSLESKVLRALLTFYPNDQRITFEPEFRWLYHSWTEMMANESSLWRTDLIVYTTEYETMFKTLDCVYDEIRKNSEEKPKCRIFPYVRIKDRETKHQTSTKHQIIDFQRSQLLYKNLRNYGYIDSINTVFEYYLSYSMYDYVLRTDLDCFLTQNFALYVPYNHSLLVGHGGYSTAFNNQRLKRIAHDMDWGYANKNSLGSTW